MITHKIFLVFMFGCVFHEIYAKNTCNTYLRELANAQHLFVHCTVVNVSPALSCTTCSGEHKTMIEMYDQLTSVKNCSDMYIDKNRLNVVYNMEKTLNEFWSNGFCEDCTSNDTLEFNHSLNDFESCLNLNAKTEVCKKCSSQYLELNADYRQMEQNKNGHICFDSQDAMNQTRLLWSKDLKCCHREYNFTLFYIASSLICSLPVIFYFGMYGYTKRLERNHEVLDATLNSENPSTSTGLTSSNRSSNESNPSGTGNTVDLETPQDIEDRPTEIGNSSKSKSLASGSKSTREANLPSGSGKIIDGKKSTREANLPSGSGKIIDFETEELLLPLKNEKTSKLEDVKEVKKKLKATPESGANESSAQNQLFIDLND